MNGCHTMGQLYTMEFILNVCACAQLIGMYEWMSHNG